MPANHPAENHKDLENLHPVEASRSFSYDSGDY